MFSWDRHLLLQLGVKLLRGYNSLDFWCSLSSDTVVMHPDEEVLRKNLIRHCFLSCQVFCIPVVAQVAMNSVVKVFVKWSSAKSSHLNMNLFSLTWNLWAQVYHFLLFGCHNLRALFLVSVTLTKWISELKVMLLNSAFAVFHLVQVSFKSNRFIANVFSSLSLHDFIQLLVFCVLKENKGERLLHTLDFQISSVIYTGPEMESWSKQGNFPWCTGQISYNLYNYHIDSPLITDTDA